MEVGPPNQNGFSPGSHCSTITDTGRWSTVIALAGRRRKCSCIPHETRPLAQNKFPGSIVFGIFLRVAPCLRPCWIRLLLPSFFSQWLKFCYQNRPTTPRNRIKVDCLHIVGGVYQSRLQITIIIIERSRFAGSICSGSVKERIDVRCQSAVTRPRYDTTATKIHP